MNVSEDLGYTTTLDKFTEDKFAEQMNVEGFLDKAKFGRHIIGELIAKGKYHKHKYVLSTDNKIIAGIVKRGRDGNTHTLTIPLCINGDESLAAYCNYIKIKFGLNSADFLLYSVTYYLHFHIIEKGQ